MTGRLTDGIARPATRPPARPANELTRMNGADTAATRFTGAASSASKAGVRNTPPPTPVSPESSPIAPPSAASQAGGSGFRGAAALFSAGSSRSRQASRTIRRADASRTTPTSISKAFVGRSIAPPAAAQGTLAAASGRKIRERKCPARKNCTLAIVATITLSTSAVGRITAGSSPRSVITAM